MPLVSIKTIVAMLWVSTVSILGIAGRVHSVSSWTVLAAVLVVPPLVMMWRWNDPLQTISARVQEARR